jgi:hypothetical protein
MAIEAASQATLKAKAIGRTNSRMDISWGFGGGFPDVINGA